jgi:hypothetical protein
MAAQTERTAHIKPSSIFAALADQLGETPAGLRLNFRQHGCGGAAAHFIH